MPVLRLFGLSASALLSAWAMASASCALAAEATFMPSAMSVDAPPGYVRMCQTDAELCSDSPSSSAAASSSGLILASLAASDSAPQGLLDRVNRYVNGRVRRRLDAPDANGDEVWRRSGVGRGAQGDCKDIAVEKRLELIALGYPAQDLFYAIAFRQDIGLHAVLIAHTAQGDRVLDSRSPYIVAWSQVPYLWVKRQTLDHSGDWALVNGPHEPAVRMRLAALDLNSGPESAIRLKH